MYCSYWHQPPYGSGHRVIHAGGGLWEGLWEVKKPIGRLREETDSFTKSMDDLSATLNKQRLKAAMNDLFVMIKSEGAYGVTSQDIVNISQNRRLSPDQTLQLFGFLQQARSLESAKSESQKEPSSEVIECKIDGDFKGWEGETIVKLTNGQIWQQSEYYYCYHYAFMPGVIIFRYGGGFKMKVDGVDKSVGVSQLK